MTQQNTKPDLAQEVLKMRADMAELISTIDVMRKADDALWARADIKEYVKFKSVRNLDAIIASKGFPKPVDIPGTSHPRWFAEEVRQYFKKLNRR